jgi:hypothetical protein
MVRKAFVLAVLVLLAMVGPAVAGQGTLYTADLAAFGPPLAEEALAQIRGGFQGMAFSVFFSTFVANTTSDLAGFLAVNTSTPPAPGGVGGTDTTVTNGGVQVRVAAIVGTAFQGASGIFQITQVPGNNNIVIPTLNIQIVLINVPSTAAIPSFTTLFR